MLVVDDEPYARSAARRVLKSLNHRVIEAGNARQAQEIVQRGEQIDLLLTDVNMPETSGFELAESLQQLRPGLRTLFMCGYPIETLEDTPPAAEFIEKPFTFEDLVQRVSQMLADDVEFTDPLTQ